MWARSNRIWSLWRLKICIVSAEIVESDRSARLSLLCTRLFKSSKSATIAYYTNSHRSSLQPPSVRRIQISRAVQLKTRAGWWNLIARAWVSPIHRRKGAIHRKSTTRLDWTTSLRLIRAVQLLDATLMTCRDACLNCSRYLKPRQQNR